MLNGSRVMKLGLGICLLGGVFLSDSGQAQEPVGERWSAVRGDGSPGVSYSSFVETPNGRWLAAGPGGQLMLSDNSGGDWRYQVILDADGQPVFGNISDMVVVGNTVVATLVGLRDSSGGESNLPYVGRTRILSSGNNGESWTVSEFPIQTALFNGFPFPGVFLSKLFLAPNGQLLAYGSTVQSNGAVGYFIGGAIFRQQGGTWEQANFELGPLQSMSVADNGRLVAAGFQTVLDSADGAGWNGYSLTDANMNLNGQPLSFEVKEALNASDITFVGNNYVMQTQQFRRSTANENIFIVGNERSVIFTSPNPFDGGRIWNGTQAPRVYPNWINMGSRLVSAFDKAFSSSGGTSWVEVDDTVAPFASSVGRVDSQGIVAVGNSDEVWQSADGGQSWNKSLDADPGENLRLEVFVGNVMLARAGNNAIWRSVDNGNTWVEGADYRDQTGRSGLTPLRRSGNRVFATQGDADRIITSADLGLNWEVLPVPGSGGDDLLDVVVGQGGRLIVAPESRGISPPETDFFTSDDDGQTWVPRTAPLSFGETPKRGLHVGKGRIIYLMNGFASFEPELVTSNDNGVTWQREDPFQVMEGLNRVSNEPETRVIDLQKIVQTEAGTLIILGGNSELLVSHDLGLSWEVTLNLEAADAQFLRWNISDVVESDGRLVAVVFRDSPASSSFKENFAYISEDEGMTWRIVPIPVTQGNTAFTSAQRGANGRLIISGSNGAVYVADSLLTDRDLEANFSVREGESLTLEVPRPPSEGNTTVTYRLLADSATAGTDFVQTMGQLTWLEGDNTPQSVLIETIDDLQPESPEDLRVEFSVSGDLIMSFANVVTITDNEGRFERGVDIIASAPIVTSEDGAEDTFGVALSRQPTDPVTVNLDVNLPGEVAFQPATLTFTPANWNQSQTVTVTGLDDNVRDRNRTVQILFTPTSNDPEYQGLEPGIAYVVNVDNEQDVVVFNTGFEPE